MPMTLRQYLFDRPTMRQRTFAALVGVDEARLSLLVNGKAKPTVEQVARIEEATGGAVKASDWLMPQVGGK